MSLLGRRETREILARHGLKPKTSLGQHFLVDPNTIRKIIRLAAPRRGEPILEVGAGLGALTVALAQAGARVLAVEHDRALAPALEEVLHRVEGVKVVWGDALRLDYDRLLGRSGARVVSNLPYQIATPLVLRLLENPAIPELIVMVQKEVGERLTASPGTEAYGAVSAKIAYHASSEVAFGVSRRVFLPEPDVDSVVVRIRRRESPPVAGARSRIFSVIDAGFAVRRKTIRNALRSAGVEPPRVEDALATAGVDGSARAERLGLEEFAAIARLLHVRSPRAPGGRR